MCVYTHVLGQKGFVLLFKEINTFIQQECIKLIKSDKQMIQIISEGSYDTEWHISLNESMSLLKFHRRKFGMKCRWVNDNIF